MRKRNRQNRVIDSGEAATEKIIHMNIICLNLFNIFYKQFSTRIYRTRSSRPLNDNKKVLRTFASRSLRCRPGHC